MVTHEARADVPFDLGPYEIAILRRDDAGGWTTLPATLGEPGEFLVDPAPDGEYLLKFGNLYVSTFSRRPDLGWTKMGREGLGDTESTRFYATLDNLEPWTDDDDIGLIVTNAGGVAYANDGQLVDGTTYVGDITYSGPTFEPELGDRLLFSQRSGKRLEVGTLHVTTRMVETADVTWMEGVAVVEGAMTPLALDSRLEVEWDLMAFEDRAPQVSPFANAGEHYLSIDALPGRSSDGSYTSATLNLASIATYLDSTYVGEDFNYAVLPPGDWFRRGGAWNTYYLEIPIPETSTTTVFPVYATLHRSLAASDQWTIEPQLDPPTPIFVNGEDATDAVSGAGMTPTISWTEPTSGADYYSVSVHSLAIPTNMLARFYTAETQIHVPDGILTTAPFFVVVRAVREPNADLHHEPFRSTLPFESMPGATGGIQP